MHIMPNHAGVVEWFKGSSLRPFYSVLEGKMREQYLAAYTDAIARAYSARYDGKVMLKFPRLFILACASHCKDFFFFSFTSAIVGPLSVTEKYRYDRPTANSAALRQRQEAVLQIAQIEDQTFETRRRQEHDIGVHQTAAHSTTPTFNAWRAKFKIVTDSRRKTARERGERRARYGPPQRKPRGPNSETVRPSERTDQ